MEKSNDFTSVLISEKLSPNIASLVDIYKQDKVKARVIYTERRNTLRYNNEYVYSFEYPNKDLRIVSFSEKIFFTKKNVMYKRKSSPYIIIYKHAAKSFYLKRGKVFKVMMVGELFQYLGETNLYIYLVGKFGFLRNLYEIDECRHLTLGTIIKKKLFNREKIIKHIYGVNHNVAKVLAEAKKSDGNITFIWKQYKHLFINLDSLTPSFFKDNMDILHDTFRYADMFGEKINAKWKRKRLVEEHDKMYRRYIDIILEFEPLRELNIKQVYKDFKEFTNFDMLTTNHQLIEEGKKQNHCVGTYVNQVNSGSCAIFTIDEYTLEVRFEKRSNWDNNLKRFKDDVHRLHLNQLRGYKNKSAPKELQDVVEEAINAFNLTIDDEKRKEYINVVSLAMVSVNHDDDLPF
jgi:hypothetical protein